MRDERGHIVPLRPRAWAVLRLLATRAGQLVGKDEIMDEVWSDCEVTEDSLVQAIGDIRRALGDAGRSALKTLPRRGYMLVTNGEPTDGAVVSGDATSRSSNIEDLAAPSSMPHLSIIVLPFANIGGDLAQDYFVDGVTESLTTDLSRIAGSFVIGRNTAFTLKGKAVDTRQIGRDLNVRYVLEGSVQHGGNRFRLNAQLTDTAAVRGGAGAPCCLTLPAASTRCRRPRSPARSTRSSTKTITPEPREGNPPVRIAETEAGMLNSIGLANPGRERFSRDPAALRGVGMPLWVSVGGFSAGSTPRPAPRSRTSRRSS